MGKKSFYFQAIIGDVWHGEAYEMVETLGQ